MWEPVRGPGAAQNKLVLRSRWVCPMVPFPTAGARQEAATAEDRLPSGDPGRWSPRDPWEPLLLASGATSPQGCGNTGAR